MTRQRDREQGIGADLGGVVDRWIETAPFGKKVKTFTIIGLLLTGGVGEYLGHGPRALLAWLNRPAFAEHEERLVAIQTALNTVAQNQVTLSENQLELNGAVSELHGYSDAVRRYNMKKEQDQAKPKPLAPVPGVGAENYMPNLPNAYDLTRR